MPLPEGAGYLGFIFARGETPAAVEAALREAHAALRFDMVAAARRCVISAAAAAVLSASAPDLIELRAARLRSAEPGFGEARANARAARGAMAGRRLAPAARSASARTRRR